MRYLLGDLTARSFVIQASVFGLLLLFLIPPFQVADENQHFYRAFSVTDGHFWIHSRRGAVFGEDLPKSLIEVADRVSEGIAYHPENKQDIGKLKVGFSMPLQPGDRIFANLTPVAKYSAFPYLPQALGIGLGRLIDLPPLALLYLARLANLVFFVLTAALAIRLGSVFGLPLFLLALTPMCLSQAASASGDVATNAAALLFVGAVLNLAFEGCAAREEPRGPAVFAMFAAAILLSLSKPPYQLIVFSYLLIPTPGPDGRKRYWMVFAFLILATIGVSAAVSRQVQDAGMTPYYANASLNPKGQLRFIFDHPSAFPVAAFRAVLRQGGFIVRSFIGQLGWLDVKLHAVHVIAYLVTILVACFAVDFRGVGLGLKQRLIGGIVGLGVLLAVFFLLYLHWTPVGASEVRGVVGRYLIPIAPLLFLSICAGAIRVSERSLRRLAFGSVTCSGLAVVYAVVRRYYL